jgi:hypothetical protein
MFESDARFDDDRGPAEGTREPSTEAAQLAHPFAMALLTVLFPPPGAQFGFALMSMVSSDGEVNECRYFI